MIGRQLSHYSVLAKLGEGGMGEVYLAEDLELKRSVALKILPPELAANPERLARFRREAESLAAISHPNIVTVFSIEQVGDLHILTMERVEGRGLDELLPEGGMPLDQLLEVGIALSGALAAAHEKGITHRDLKPQNLMLTEEGQLKVLDFGLAKLQREAVSQISATRKPGGPRAGKSLMITREETIIGTVPYMSPEQIENKAVDGRSDVFCCGIVLYELATGERPFQGDSMASVMSAILKERPKPVFERRRELPRELDRVLSRCMEKEPANRYQTARELQRDLRSLARDRSSSASWRPATWPRMVRWLVAGVLLLAVGLFGWRAFLPAPVPELGSTVVAVMPFENTGSADDDYFAAAMAHGIARFLQESGLGVVSPLTAGKHAAVDKSPSEIGTEIGVNYLLRASVRLTEVDGKQQVLVTPELQPAHDEARPWVLTPYDRRIPTPRDIPRLQRDIANEVLDRLGIELRLESSDNTRLTDNAEAHTEYLKGLYHHGKRTADSFAKAIQHWQRAIQLDQDFLEVHSLLGGLWTAYPWYCLEGPKAVYPKVRASLEKVREAGNPPREFWANYALLLVYDNDFQGAEEAYRKAIAPSRRYPKGLPLGHHWYGNTLSAWGRHDEALRHARTAQKLEPLSAIITTHVGLRYYFDGEFKSALDEMNDALSLEPDFVPGRWHRSWVHGMLGNHDEAILDARKARLLSKNNQVYRINLAWALALRGTSDDLAEVRRLLAELAEIGKTRFISGYHMAAVHVALGDKRKALQELERALDENDDWCDYMKVEPRFIPLRNDPQFTTLARRLGF